jgi:hypothetical protein
MSWQLLALKGCGLGGSLGNAATHVFSFDARSGMLGARSLLQKTIFQTNDAQKVRIGENHRIHPERQHRLG